MTLIAPGLLDGLVVVGSDDTAPWNIPDLTIDAGAGNSGTMGWRFGSGGGKKGTLQYTAASGGTWVDAQAGTFHEDEGTAVYTGSDFQVWYAHISGTPVLDELLAEETWHTLAAQRDFTREIAVGAYTSVGRFKIRIGATQVEVATGVLTLTQERA